MVEALKKFRIYLIGVQFRVVTDCSSLRYTLLKRDLVPRIARWWLTIQEFDFTIEYRPGTKMAHVDALSRSLNETTSFEGTLNVNLVNIAEDDWVQSAQLQDQKCKNIMNMLACPYNSKESQRIHKEYCLKDNRLYRITPVGDKWVVPSSARRRILMYYHDGYGHNAVEKTLEVIRDRYWFPYMTKYVRNYINSCLGCLYNKVPSGKIPGRLNPIPKENIPLDTLHIDHLGPFVMSVKKNSYLIVVVDGFTKFVFVKAVPNTKTAPVIKFLRGL